MIDVARYTVWSVLSKGWTGPSRGHGVVPVDHVDVHAPAHERPARQAEQLVAHLHALRGDVAERREEDACGSKAASITRLVTVCRWALGK